MKKIILLLIVFGLLYNVSCRDTTDVAVTPRQSKTYLVAGIDDAAENTDVLILASYNMADGTSTIVHIPRDTLCKYSERYCKINSIFPYERSNGHTRQEAMSCLANYVSDTFGVLIDGYFCIDSETVIKAVDLIGGVDIELNQDLPIADENGEILYTLKAGKNHLDGASALNFVRYRKGYATGDLGRIDAQKLFISALLKSARDDIGIDEAAKICVSVIPRITTNVGVTELVGVRFNARLNKQKSAIDYITIPGEAAMIGGTSFYIINRKSAADTFERDFSLTSDGFDPKRFLTDKSNGDVENIYNK